MNIPQRPSGRSAPHRGAAEPALQGRGGVLVTILLAVSCSDGPTFPHTNQTWALSTVDGQSLPAVVEFGHSTFTVFADTIRFIGDDDWRRSQAFVERSRTGHQTLRLPTSSGFITVRDETIVLASDCDDVGQCAPHALLIHRGNTLHIAQQFSPPIVNLEFRQVTR